MADKILKNATGEIWKNTDGKIIKNRVFSESVLTDGLQFWGVADSNYLTLVSGLVSEAYDIRGAGQKMIQNTVGYRPTLINNLIYFNNYYSVLSKTGGSMLSAFMVFKAAEWSGITSTGGYNTKFLGSTASNKGMFGGGTHSCYVNSTKYVNVPGPALNSTLTIIHSLTNMSVGSTHTLGCLSASVGMAVKEWGWYNRLLSDREIIYNINALNAKYAIF